MTTTAINICYNVTSTAISIYYKAILLANSNLHMASAGLIVCCCKYKLLMILNIMVINRWLERHQQGCHKPLREMSPQYQQERGKRRLPQAAPVLLLLYGSKKCSPLILLQGELTTQWASVNMLFIGCWEFYFSLTIIWSNIATLYYCTCMLVGVAIDVSCPQQFISWIVAMQV